MYQYFSSSWPLYKFAQPWKSRPVFTVICCELSKFVAKNNETKKVYSPILIIQTSIIWISRLSGLASLVLVFTNVNFCLCSNTLFHQIMWQNSVVNWIYFISKHRSECILRHNQYSTFQCAVIGSELLLCFSETSFTLLYVIQLCSWFINIYILDDLDSQLSGPLSPVPTSPDTRSLTVELIASF